MYKKALKAKKSNFSYKDFVAVGVCAFGQGSRNGSMSLYVREWRSSNVNPIAQVQITEK